MPTRTLVYADHDERAAMQARLLAYHRLTVPDCVATIWDNPTISGNAYTITADDRVIDALTAAEKTVNIVADGESTTDGTGAAVGLDYLTQLMGLPNWVGKGLSFNQGFPSQNISHLVSQYATEVYPLRPTGDIVEAWLLVMIGIKDAGENRTAAQMLADVEAYMTTAKNDGFTVVALTTNYNSGFTAGQKTALADYNAGLLASAVPDFAVDTAAAVGQPDTHPANYADAVHPNATGYGLIAAAINAAITP